MRSIMYKGVPIYFETLEDAMEAIDKSGGSVGASGERKTSRPTTGDGRWTMSRFNDFIGRLTDGQQKLLRELVSSPHGRMGRDLAPTLGFKSPKAFGPVLAAMSKHAKKTGVGFQEVMS